LFDRDLSQQQQTPTQSCSHGSNNSNTSNTSNNYNCCLKITAQKSACGPLSPSWPSSFHAACNFASAEEPAEPEEATEDLGREGQSNQHTMQTTCLPKC